MKIKTPAKINTQLYILRKRSDGYHELYMHMVPITLFDTITFQPNSDQGIQFSMEGVLFDGDMESNLVVKAVRAFEKASGIKVHQSIHLEKNIPVGAGLGGGSGNAAGTLQALNHYYNAPLSSDIIYSIAASIGSDVPFFLNPRPCEVRGRGEFITDLHNYPRFFLVVIKPTFSIPTKIAYAKCKPVFLSEFPVISDNKSLGNSLFNQFENTLFTEYPQLLTLKRMLIQYGAFGALVSGSGSSVFGAFTDESFQKQAARILSEEVEGSVFCCKSLLEYQYF